MQQSGIFSNEKLHEYRYSVPVCYNHGGKKMSEICKNNCQNPYNICYDNFPACYFEIYVNLNVKGCLQWLLRMKY